MTYAYVGSRTTRERNARGEGLKVYSIDNKTGKWDERQCIMKEENPSYQTFDNNKEFLYSVHGDITKITSYKVEKDGTLTYINTVDINAKNPVFVTCDKTNKFLVVATLQGGALFSLKRNEDGSIGEIVDKIAYEGKDEDKISFVHQCIWDQNKEYIFAPAQGRIQGYGQIRVFRFDSNTGKLTQTCQVKSREYAEPRHIAIHPNNKFAYMINEKDNTMIYFGFNEVEGTLEPRQIVPTLPDTYTGEGQASACVIDPTGQLVIGSNRIHESIVLYRINQETGYMTTVGYFNTLGNTPRFMTFDDNGDKLYVANEDSDTIVEMKVDISKNSIEYTGNMIRTESPVCITFK